MAIYTVHVPETATSAETVAEQAVFVKEGYSFFGFIFTGLWLLLKGLWPYALAYAALLALTFGAFTLLQLPMALFGPVQLLLAVLIGLEGHEWQRQRLARKGYRHAGTISGPSLEECERRFFKNWIAGQPAAVRRPGAPTGAGMPLAATPPAVLGSFPTVRSGA